MVRNKIGPVAAFKVVIVIKDYQKRGRKNTWKLSEKLQTTLNSNPTYNRRSSNFNRDKRRLIKHKILTNG